jgi:transposase
LSLPSLTPRSAPAPASKVAAVAAEAIHLEFKRGALDVSVTWPVSAATDCAAWLREVLR